MTEKIVGLPDNEEIVIPVDSITSPLSVELIKTARELGIKQADLVRKILYERGKSAYPVHVLDGRVESLTFVPGHVWSREPRMASPGPRFRSDVMIIDKSLDRAAENNKRIFSGDSGQLFAQLLRYAGHESFHNYYVTTLLKTRVPDNKAAYKQFWTRDQLHLLYQELFLIRPKFILLLGAEVAKALIGTTVKVSRVEHLVHDLTFTAVGQEPLAVKACVSMRPEALVYSRDDYQRKKVIQQLAQFRGVIGDKKQLDVTKKPPGHVVIDDERQIIEWFNRVRMDSKAHSENLICVDCEWEGEHPQTNGAFLRSVQVSGREGQAVTIAITHPGGAPRLKVFRRFEQNGKVYVDKRSDRMTTEGSLQVLARHIERLLKDRRICGHQIKADLEWLEYIGVDIYKSNLAVPDTPNGCKTQGPMDTLLAAHAYDEQADLGLDDQVLVHLPHVPKYTEVLDKHIEEYCKRNKISKSSLRGYGHLDDEPLYFYAGYDVDAGIQLALFYLRKLRKDAFGNDCWPAYHISIGAMYGAYEITKVGLQFNKHHADNITLKFMIKRAELLGEIRKLTNWPDLNLESTDQVRELLFGRRYNAKIDNERIRPAGAKTLNALPLLSTGKYQKAWSEIQELGEEYKFKVSCNRTVIGLLLLDAERLKVRRKNPKTGKWKIYSVDATKFIQLIRDYRLVSQQLKGPLRPPTDPPPELDDWDPEEPYYDKGIPGSVCNDGQVRTTILMTKETGRWSSIKPPLQNLSSAAEKQLEKLFKEDYPGSVKLMLEAKEDYYLVAADIGGAELRMTAVQSQDEKFIDATERLSLPEDHPDHLDIHGSITVSAFSLPCRPTKSAIEAYGRDDLRTGAKTVIFGKFYGQSIQASVIAVRQRGVHATFDQLQAISDKFDDTYPEVLEYFRNAMKRVTVGYTTSWAGRYRRFPITNDVTKVRSLQREALNAGIQGGVADYVSKCIPIALKYRDENRLDARLVLQKHDELMFMVHKSHLRQFCMEGVPHFMRDALHFWAADFEGVRIPGTPDYKFSYDLDVMKTWGKKIKGDALKELGIAKPS
jgi:DNA polymerase-1